MGISIEHGNKEKSLTSLNITKTLQTVVKDLD